MPVAYFSMSFESLFRALNNRQYFHKVSALEFEIGEEDRQIGVASALGGISR